MVPSPLHFHSLESIGRSPQRRFFSVSLGFLPDGPKQAREYTYVGISLLPEGSQRLGPGGDHSHWLCVLLGSGDLGGVYN